MLKRSDNADGTQEIHKEISVVNLQQGTGKLLLLDKHFPIS